MKANNLSETLAEGYYNLEGSLSRFSFRQEGNNSLFFKMPDLMRKMPDYIFHKPSAVYLVEVKGCKHSRLKLKVGDFFHYSAWEQFTGLAIKLFIVDYYYKSIYEISFDALKLILSKMDVIISQTHDSVNWFEIDYKFLEDWKVKDL